MVRLSVSCALSLCGRSAKRATMGKADCMKKVPTTINCPTIIIAEGAGPEQVIEALGPAGVGLARRGVQVQGA